MKNNLTLTECAALIKDAKLSSEEVTQNCLDTIKIKNKKLNAYITLNPNALTDAQAKDKDKSKNGKLHGIPFAIKDNFLTRGLRTTASSRVLDSYIPQYNATVVEKLLAEGAVIIGKTNMDAWAHGSSTETSDYGPTKNPWNTDYLPGGSSGGSAAATASDMCIFSIGSETAGSVRGPAAWCGCVGFKPTYGRVSRYGVIAMGSSLDCPGPITKSVADSTLLLEILTGKDNFDATTSPSTPDAYTGYLKTGVEDMKIGIASDYFLPGMKNDVKESVIKAAKVFERLGAKIDYVKTLDPQLAIAVYTIIQRSEVSSNLARYDGVRYGNNRSYFAEEAKRRIMLGTFSLSTGYSDKYYRNALKLRTLFIQDFAKIFKKYDLLIGPTMPGPAPKIGITEGADMYGEMTDVLTEPSSISGLPGISLPCGFINNLPVGLDIFGPQFSEAKIIAAASAYEQATTCHLEKPKVIYEKQ